MKINLTRSMIPHMFIQSLKGNRCSLITYLEKYSILLYLVYG